jgi:hypothetical protein
MKTSILEHEFVVEFPAAPEPGVLYVSLEYGTALHMCCCGCGNRVVTPFSPRDWKLIFDGESVSLDPSIGNWSFPCRSHYWISGGRIQWAAQWSVYRVNRNRGLDRDGSRLLFSNDECRVEVACPPNESRSDFRERKRSFILRIRDWCKKTRSQGYK